MRRTVKALTWKAFSACFLLALALAVAFPGHVEAYAGPGAGFALVTSFLVVFAAVGLALVYLAVWPFRSVFRLALGRRAFARARARRVVIVGLDGLDAGLSERFLKEGKLPHLGALHYQRLDTTNPSISPVAWSTFQTGLDPSGHGIFDFLRPARPAYCAEMSSVRISQPARSLKLGKRVWPLGRPHIRLRRHGVPFWKILGDHGIFSAVIRVPVSFPPERFHGVSLSAMCVPDLRGTQGTFTLYTSQDGGPGAAEGGTWVRVKLEGTEVRAGLVGPPNPILAGNPPLEIPFRASVDAGGDRASLRIDGKEIALSRGRHTPWVRVTFRAGFGIKIRGLVRFCLVETSPSFKLYASPVQFDPEHPALPISHPRAYSVYLAKLLGPYGTLGLAEDTWSLNQRAVRDGEFLDGTYRIHEEREAMLFDALDKVRRGLVVCVFDASDRIQHMFLRTLHADHPANRSASPEADPGIIEDMYRRMDDFIGRTRARLGAGDVLLVISDHGMRPFKRGINLNAWLRGEGYLRLAEDSRDGGAWFSGVDWSQTSAYALGLSGLYLNLKGREAQGTVDPRDAPKLKAALRKKIEELKDPEHPESTPVRRVFDPEELYRGPYRDEAPDLLVGYGDGYRISWSGATGTATGDVFEDNSRPWSGDHCVDPALVPGVLFSSLPLPGGPAGLADMATTVLDLFGVRAPPALKGRRLFEEATP